MMSCRKHLGILLFRRRSGQHCDVHTVANYDKLPPELRRAAVRDRSKELGSCARTGVWDDMVSWPRGERLKSWRVERARRTWERGQSKGRICEY